MLLGFPGYSTWGLRFAHLLPCSNPLNQWKDVEGLSCVASSIGGTIAAKMAQLIFLLTVNQHLEKIESRFFPNFFFTRTRPLGVGFEDSNRNDQTLQVQPCPTTPCRWRGAIRSAGCPGPRSSCPSLKAKGLGVHQQGKHVTWKNMAVHLENMVALNDFT